MPVPSHSLPCCPVFGDGTLFALLEQTARRYPDRIALDFLGKSTSYRRLAGEVRTCARALQALGIRAGDRVTLALPNCPQAVCLFYAVSLAGGVANMVHPLSAEAELEDYLRQSDSRTVVTLDRLYPKLERVRRRVGPFRLILTGIQDALSLPAKAGYLLTEGRKTEKIPASAPVLRWKDFLRLSRFSPSLPAAGRSADDPAVILYSGGTTGTTKGVVLTSRNFNALSRQVIAVNPMFAPGDKMLAAMPLFHGFGLGVCIHTMLTQGGRCVLVPRFTPKSYAKDLVKHRCQYLAGVPTLYEALLAQPGMEGADLSCLKGVFVGGDSLSPGLKARLDRFLREHGATVQVREGYGTTETVTACCLTPAHRQKAGSIGLPFPGNRVKIVDPGTGRELPCGEEGEILLSGPTVMQGYLGHPEETARTLVTHSDGFTWVRTGDLGRVDSEGFVYFRGRAKRMIVSSGYNIYPARLEQLLDAHPAVGMSCVIGLPDPYKMQKVKAFVVPAEGVPPTEATRQALLEHCRRHLPPYAIPGEIAFRTRLPQTPVGKVAYRLLEEEERSRMPPS